ncbi:hypothetical protein ABIB38_000943 [Massilia sp. UYP11]|uniref:hypothetical protein n=1 Tax=Massilia sp. UYP11 TaxID=1756385 RepID=UPI003D1C4ED2
MAPRALPTPAHPHGPRRAALARPVSTLHLQAGPLDLCATAPLVAGRRGSGITAPYTGATTHCHRHLEVTSALRRACSMYLPDWFVVCKKMYELICVFMSTESDGEALSLVSKGATVVHRTCTPERITELENE